MAGRARRNGVGRPPSNTIDYRIERPFEPAPIGRASAGPMGTGAMATYLAGIDRLMGSVDKLSNTYFKIQHERQQRDAQTSLSHDLRNNFMEMAKDPKYQGAGADNMVSDWEESSKGVYDKWREANPDVNGNIGEAVFRQLNDSYLNRTAAIQMGRVAEYDTQSRVAAVMDTIDTEALSPLSAQAYENVVNKAKEMFPNDLKMQRMLINKGTGALSKAGAQLSPGAFVSFAKGSKKKIKNIVGEESVEMLEQDITGAEAQVEADQQYAVAQKTTRRQKAAFAKAESRKEALVGAVKSWADTGEWPAPGTPTKLPDGSMGTLLEALGPNQKRYMNMFKPEDIQVPIVTVRANANEVMRTLPADPTSALMNAQYLRSKGQIGDLELNQIASQYAFWAESKARKMQPLGSDRIMMANEAIDSRINPKLTAQEQFDQSMRKVVVDPTVQQQRIDAAIELKLGMMDYIKAQRAAKVPDEEIDAQLSINDPSSWLSKQIAAHSRGSYGRPMPTTPIAPAASAASGLPSDIDFSKGVQ